MSKCVGWDKKESLPQYRHCVRSVAVCCLCFFGGPDLIFFSAKSVIFSAKFKGHNPVIFKSVYIDNESSTKLNKTQVSKTNIIKKQRLPLDFYIPLSFLHNCSLWY